jgi:hypothetical protein
MRGESGQGIVEFALVVPFICVLVLVLVDFGKAMNYWLDLNRVANEVARVEAVNSPVTESSIRGRLLSTELRGDACVNVAFPDGRDVGDRVDVELTSDYHWFDVPGWIPLGGILTIKGRATMRLEQLATNPELHVCAP